MCITTRPYHLTFSFHLCSISMLSPLPTIPTEISKSTRVSIPNNISHLKMHSPCSYLTAPDSKELKCCRPLESLNFYLNMSHFLDYFWHSAFWCTLKLPQFFETYPRHANVDHDMFARRPPMSYILIPKCITNFVA